MQAERRTTRSGTAASGRRPPRRLRRLAVLAIGVGLVALALMPAGPVVAEEATVVDGGSNGGRPAWVTPAVRSDVSGPLADMAAAPPSFPAGRHQHINKALPAVPSSEAPDPVLQQTDGTAAPAVSTGFDGLGVGFFGPRGGFSVRWAPPDTNGAVGPNHYIQIVNTDFAIFSKTGTVLDGPIPTNTLWSGFGGSCQSRNDGDGIVEYDRLADRWVITQFTNDGTDLECVAVSTTGDPLGTYARYAFHNSAFPDYPKLAVWPDAYYITFNLFNGNGFAGGLVCAYDRAKMLAAQPATQQCFNVGTSYGGLLPSDLDGSTPPPAGSPNFILNYGSSRLNLWRFHVDWDVPQNTTLTGPTAIAVASFSGACSGGGSCIPQPGTGQKLASLGDRLMSRLVYRNFGTHESLVVNHSVGGVFGGTTGVRWYELRNPAGTASVYQQGTYSPDSTYRWMGSIAMDEVGNIGLGYSASSSSVRPSIRYTGHLVTDPLGVMGQGEGILQPGIGSQLPSLARWGDYSSMTVDPVDDCTFWYTNEYLKSDGTWNWSTRIGSFKFASCGAAPPAGDFSLSVSPESRSVTAGGSTTYAVTVTPLDGFDGSVSLSAAGLPAGATVSFSPNPATTTSTMTVTTTDATPPGTYPLTIDGTSATLTHSTTASLVVAPAPGFSLSVSPASVTIVGGGTATYTIGVSPTNGFTGSVGLSVSGLPSKSTFTFSPNPVTVAPGAAGTSTLQVKTATTPRGTFTFTVTGTSGGLTRTATGTLTVTRK